MFDQGLHEDALAIYETLSADETVHRFFFTPINDTLLIRTQTSSLRIVFQAAACHRGMGDFEEAAQIYQHSEPLMLYTSLLPFA